MLVYPPPPAPDTLWRELARHDVIWTAPSEDSAGSMPIGNGEVVVNVWVERSTGDVMLLIARTDALSEVSRILKLGRVRLRFAPSPFAAATDFVQKLSLADGTITLRGGGALVRLFVDSGSHVVHVQGAFDTPGRVTATLETWRTVDRAIPKEEQRSAWSAQGAPFELRESADVILSGTDHLSWAHRNEWSVVPELWKQQSLEGLKGLWDPILHRTFGGRISGRGFKSESPTRLSAVPTKVFALQIATHTGQTSTLGGWQRALRKVAASSPLDEARRRTAAWWRGLWQRSWVFVPNQPELSQANALQRYVQACQGRGEFPIKFNGGYYTVEPAPMGQPLNADWRQWGDAHWFQNVRFTVHPMLAQGDFEQMEAFWRLYERALPLAMARAKSYHGAKGAYFPETMTPFGTYAGQDYGWDRTGLHPNEVQCPWWQYAWNQGPELVALMLDRWEITQDRAFLRERALPMAEQVLLYFDSRFEKDEQGRIVLDPTQVVETYWKGVVNDAPTVAGLIAITERLMALPEREVPARLRSYFARMRDACPELPFETHDGKPELAPAQRYVNERSNVENGELYPVFPFRLVDLGRKAHLDAALQAYARRESRLDNGWGYDGNVAALLGLTDEARRILVGKARNSHPKYRWPATWGPNFDWLPDQNHGGNLLLTTQLMLMQADPLARGGAIRLFPAWPRDWDASFQLHAPGRTIVRARTEGGKLLELEVFPESRREHVIIPEAWR